MANLIEAIDGRSDLVIVVTREDKAYFRVVDNAVLLGESQTVVESYNTGARFVATVTGRVVSRWGYKDAMAVTLHSIETFVGVDDAIWGRAGEKFGTAHTRLANIV